MLDAAEVAARFVEARKAGQGFPEFPGAVPEALERAYAIQAAVIAGWPDDVAGWKVGRIVGPLADALGSDRFIGPIFAQTIQHSDGRAAFPAIAGGVAVLEAELVIAVNADAPAGKSDWSPEDAAALVGPVYIGIEAAGSPLASMPALGPLASIAAFGGNNGLILGPQVQGWPLSLDDIHCTASIDGAVVGQATAAAVPGGPVTAFAFALNTAAQLGIAIRRGDVISTGAITGMHPLQIGQQGSADFGQLGRLEFNVVQSPPFHRADKLSQS